MRTGVPSRPQQSDVDTDALSELSEALSDGGLGPWDWGTAAIVLVAGIVVSRLVKWGTVKVFQRRLDQALAVLIGRLTAYAIVTVAFVYALDSLGVAIGPVLGALGIVGIALAFALRDILENFVAGILLQLQRPFTYGDQIAVNEHEGTVRDIGTRLVTVVTPAGETVKIPSATVIKADVNNYTEQGLRRTTLPVGVAYGTDLLRAQEVLAAAVMSAEGVVESPAYEVLLDGFGDSSIDFVVRFWHLPTIADYWQVKSNVAFAVDRALAEAGITIPFPQRTVWWGDPSSDGTR